LELRITSQKISCGVGKTLGRGVDETPKTMPG